MSRINVPALGAGMLTAALIAGKTGEKTGYEIMIPLSDKTSFHLHHWVLSLAALLIIPTKYHAARNFIAGIGIQGLLYNDRFNFLEISKSYLVDE